MRTLFHQQGVVYAAVPGTVLFTAQLYHALQQEKCPNHVWEDLEELRKMQGNSTFFIGEPPTSYEGHFNNFCLTKGSSITNWASNKRDKKAKVAKDNKPVMKFMGLTSTLFANQTRTFGDRRPISVEVMEHWIHQGSKGQENAKTEKTQKPLSETKQTGQPLVHRLAAAVATEVPRLEFNYFAIQDLCREVLLPLQTEEEKFTGPDFTKRVHVAWSA